MWMIHRVLKYIHITEAKPCFCEVCFIYVKSGHLFLYIYELGLDDKVYGKERKGYVCVCVKRKIYFFGV